MRIAAMLEMLADQTALFPGCTPLLINPLVHINAARHLRLDELHDILPLYAAGPKAFEPVILGRYPDAVIADARSGFLAMSGGALIREQIPADLAGKPGELAQAAAQLTAGADHAMTLDAEVILACRFGYRVWGHWLHEMLPRIVAAETACPGRFAYALPAGITMPNQPQGYSSVVLGSLAAYGITPDRLIRLPPGHVYRFNAAFDLAGCWQYGLHPDLQPRMRALIGTLPPQPERRLLVLREPDDLRAISNARDIRDMLQDCGFTAITPRSMRFAEQAAAFAAAPVVAGEFGSNLAGLLYAPEGAGLLAFAPMGWRDAYFIGVMRERQGYVADIRGPSSLQADADIHRSSFMIAPADAQDGLQALLAARAGSGAPCRAGGQAHPRRLGAERLRLGFGAHAPGRAMLHGAWHAPEANLSWCAEDVARIIIPRDTLAPGDYWLGLNGFTLTDPGRLTLHPLTLAAGGRQLLQTSVTGNLHLFVAVPSICFADDGLHIELRLKAVGPADALGARGDPRHLGVGLTGLAVYDPPPGMPIG